MGAFMTMVIKLGIEGPDNNHHLKLCPLRRLCERTAHKASKIEGGPTGEKIGKNWPGSSCCLGGQSLFYARERQKDAATLKLEIPTPL